MFEVTKCDLQPGVQLTAVRTDKFKTSVLSLHFLAPLWDTDATANALLPSVLRRGTMKHPTMEAISSVLDDLYGGSIEPSVRKKGETQCVGFVANFLDDAYTPDGTKILEPTANLLGELLFDPLREEGAFAQAYVTGERANQVDKLEGIINEKRGYSIHRLTQIMCGGEAYGIDRLGDLELAKTTTAEDLEGAYEDLLAGSEVAVYYCGSADLDRVKAAVTQMLAPLPRNEELNLLDCQICTNARTVPPKMVTEPMDVTQGKLAMGFRTGGATLWDHTYAPLLVFNAIFGGTATSKLFLNVREKLSLCYFAGSMIEKIKGIMIVSAGIEFANFEAARDEIMLQFEACQKGEIEDWELDSGRRSVVSALRTAMDGQGGIEDYWLAQSVAGLSQLPEDIIEKVEAVTVEDVVAVSKHMELDTIYFLTGQEVAQ